MNLNDFYPNPDKMIENEINTVKFLSTNAYIKAEKRLEKLHLETWRCYNQFRARGRGFSFATHLDLFHKGMPGARRSGAFSGNENPNVRLILSALIEQNNNRSYGNVSYALAICRLIRSKRSAILRKFHFDITTGATLYQPYPLCHLQYCGEMLSVMRDLDYKDQQLAQLHTKVREPRLFFSPMSLALLLELTVREFGDQQFRERLLRNPEWRNLVRENEKLLLKPFYEKCAEVVNNPDRNRNLVADEFYIG